MVTKIQSFHTSLLYLQERVSTHLLVRYEIVGEVLLMKYKLPLLISLFVSDHKIVYSPN